MRINLVNILRGEIMIFNIESVDINILRKINREKALKLKIIPYKVESNRVYVYGVKESLDIKNELNFIYGKEVSFKEIEERYLISAIDNLYLGNEDNVDEIIISNAIKSNASDIHFEPRDKYTVVRMRVDGKLRITNIFTINEHLRIVSKLKLKGNLDITEKRRPQDGKITFSSNNKKYDLRLSFTNTIFGEKLVVRILYGQVFNYKLDSLSLTNEQIAKMKEIIKVNTGLVVINGPTGSGKSTTLYTILQEVNQEDINIITLEDPVEVIIPGINQIALNKTIDLSFAEALRSSLRQDPDIVMLGEIRDDETAKIAVRASITGHKVYSTIHTKDPREVFFRLEDMGVKDYFIRDSLVGIISQRLIRKLCSKCKSIEGVINIDGEKVKAYKSVGCEYCDFTGYKGRALVAAVHYINKDLKIRLHDIYDDYSLLSNKEMVESLKNLLKIGDISLDDYNNFLDMEEIDYKYEEVYLSESQL